MRTALIIALASCIFYGCRGLGSMVPLFEGDDYQFSINSHYDYSNITDFHLSARDPLSISNDQAYEVVQGIDNSIRVAVLSSNYNLLDNIEIPMLLKAAERFIGPEGYSIIDGELSSEFDYSQFLQDLFTVEQFAVMDYTASYIGRKCSDFSLEVTSGRGVVIAIGRFSGYEDCDHVARETATRLLNKLSTSSLQP